MYLNKKNLKVGKASTNVLDRAGTKAFQLVDNRKGLESENIIQKMHSDSEDGYEGDFEDDSENEYEPESEDERIDSEEIFYDKPYRGSRFFYTSKDQDTRKNLIERQTGSDGELHSGFYGDGPVIKLDSKGREIREHNKKSTKNKQPDIDHIIDFVAIDDEVNKYDDSDLSSDETEEFKNYLYNFEGNLEILSKSAHKSKRRYTRETVTKKISKEARELVKEQRKNFKTDVKAQKRLKGRRKKSKKKLVKK
ncbi:hypothetical protein [Tenacibaculum sp.]|uniref:hypothetical protein n=1 Tax=Tenacibaculum sp. TaxID=1906242 RepID=UPI003AA9271B